MPQPVRALVGNDQSYCRCLEFLWTKQKSYLRDTRWQSDEESRKESKSTKKLHTSSKRRNSGECLHSSNRMQTQQADFPTSAHFIDSLASYRSSSPLLSFVQTDNSTVLAPKNLRRCAPLVIADCLLCIVVLLISYMSTLRQNVTSRGIRRVPSNFSILLILGYGDLPECSPQLSLSRPQPRNTY